MYRVQNMQLVDNVYRSLSKGDLEALTRNVSDQFDLWAVQDAAHVPWAGHYRGKDGVKRFFEALQASLDQAIEPTESILEHDKIVVLGRSQSTVRSTGQVVEQDWVMVWTIRDGELVACRYYDDSAKWTPALKAS